MSPIKANAKWLVALACGALLGGAAIGWGEVGSSARPHATARDVRELSSVFRDVAKRARPAMVTIVTTSRQVSAPQGPADMEDGPFRDFFGRQPQMREFFRRQQQMPQHGMGSGFVIDPKGIILTNAHVVRDAQEVKVHFADGRVVRATEIKSDPRSDLAIVRVNPEQTGHLDALSMGDSSQTDVGDWVLAIGSPFELDMTVTAGIISAKGRDIGIGGHNGYKREDYLQTDAAINPGNSGGPLLNLDGEVVGINTAIATRSGGYDGIGFAIPISNAKWVASQLIKNGEVKRAYLGIHIRPVEGTLARVLNATPGQGAAVDSVLANSPAAKAGLQDQDVVLDFNGQKVNGPSDLQGVVERLEVGKAYPMTVLRDGKRVTLSVTVKEMPQQDSFVGGEDRERGPGDESAAASSKFDSLGIEISELNPQEARELHLKNAKGVLVTGVKVGSLAADSGMVEGMVIERVNKIPVTTPDQFEAAMKNVSLKQGVIFNVRTRRGTSLLAVRKD